MMSTLKETKELDGVKFESVKIEDDFLKLPVDLCRNKAVFEEFFSLSTWNNLTPAVKEHLVSNFLPEGLASSQLQLATISELFSGELKRFNVSTMQKLQKNLANGSNCSNMIKHKQTTIKKQRRLQKFQEHDRVLKLVRQIQRSKQQYCSDSQKNRKIFNDLERLTKTDQFVDGTIQNSRKRYYSELASINREAGDCELSSDEESEISNLTKMKKRQKRYSQSNAAAQAPQSNLKLLNTHTTTKRKDSDEFRLIWSNEAFKKLLTQSNEEAILDGEINLQTDTITINNIFERVVASSFKENRKIEIHPVRKSDGTKKVGRPVGRPRLLKMDESKQSTVIHDDEDLISDAKMEISTLDSNASDTKLQEIIVDSKDTQLQKSKRKGSKTHPECTKKTTVKGNQTSGIRDLSAFPEADCEPVESKMGPLKPLPDLDSIDIMHMPMDFNDVEHMNILEDITPFGHSKMPDTSEMVQQPHACFLSLVRDILCSTSDHRMTMTELRRKISMWMCNPVTPLVDTFSNSENWLDLLPSLIQFLTGEFEHQPEDFVPYIEFKGLLNIYQWIGAGRDTDNHLIPLCKYWLSRRNEMGTFSLSKVEESLDRQQLLDDMSERSSSPERSFSPPPPPRFPTNWLVRKATSEEIVDFRRQERQRYENPHLAFTYTHHGYESVVGPVKGIYTQTPGISRARGHNMLVTERPNFVTILTLVRDATARLPNGEGTRADICELLKSSQYISTTATDQILQTIVSGALDRMHTEYDPCVKYDAKRKIWIYLHRDRSEVEFEKLHLQQQGTTKHKKPLHRKNKVKASKQLKNNEVSPTIKLNKKRTLKVPQINATSSPGIFMKDTLTTSNSKMFEKLPAETKSEPGTKSIGDMVLQNIMTTPIHKTPEGTLKKVISPALINTPNAVGGKISIVRSNTADPPKKIISPVVKNLADLSKQNVKNVVSMPDNNGLVEVENTNMPSKRIIQITPPILSTARLSDTMHKGGLTTPNISRAGATLINPNIQTYVQINKPGGSNTTGMLKLIPTSEAKANIVSNITLQKGQTMLSPTQQKQIVQTLLNQQQAQKHIKSPQTVQSFIKTYTIPSGASPISSTGSHQIPVSMATTQSVPKIIQVFKGPGGRLHPINSISSSFIQEGKVPADEKHQSLNSVQQSLLVNKQTAPTPNIISKPTKNIQSVVKQQQQHHQQQQPQILNKRNIVLNVKTVATTPAVTTQPTITRIVKPGISFVQKFSQPSVKVTDTQNTFMAKVLTTGNKSQFVSLSDLTQKQNVSNSSASRPIYNTTTIEPSTSQFVQIAGSSNMQIPQYTVVSQNRPILTNIHQQKSNATNQISKPVARPINTNIIKSNTIQTSAASSSNCPTIVTSTSTGAPRFTTSQLHGLNSQQILNAKIVNVQTLAGNKLKATGGIKMVNASNLNLTRIAGKPIIITNKCGQPQRIGHSIVVADNNSSANSTARSEASVIAKSSQASIVKSSVGTHRVLVATPGQSGQFVTQQIILPSGFQGNTLNLKGLKVIPLSQATESGNGNASVIAKFVPSQHKLITKNEKDN